MIWDSFMHIIRDVWIYQPDKPLFYTGIAFWIAFTIFLAFYAILYKENRVRNIYLLVISWFIYFQMNGAFLSLLIFSCLLNYGFGILLVKQRKKVWLFAAVFLNLLLLAYFKYAYFFTDTINQLFNSELKVFNWLAYTFNLVLTDEMDTHSILLPIGISFYTFQSISYVVDVYKQKVQAVRNPIYFGFYLSFFPQLIAGPIVRAASFIPQLYQKYKLTKEEFSHSIFLIGKGLFKKIVIADFLALNFIDRVFESPMSYSGLENLMAVYSYSIQIYCDFSGYTDIAIGLALMLGFKIPINFNAPYQATSLTDFWHRWHISLSLWLKDYLYIPLGGNRKGTGRSYVNIAITMLIGGLWHGASIRFLIWGAIHGVGLVVEKAIRRLFQLGTGLSRWKEALSVFFTFQLVSIAWIFFRIKDFDSFLQLLNQLQYHFVPRLIEADWISYLPVIAVFFLGLLLIWTPFSLKEKIRGRFISSPLLVQFFFILALLLIISMVSNAAVQPFIYFRF